MRTTDDFEDRLQKYRPVAPPPGLRNRVLNAVSRDVEVHRPAARMLIEWIPAAAAFVLATALFWLAANERRDIESQLISTASTEQADSAAGEGAR